MHGQKLFSVSLGLMLAATVCLPAHADLLKNFKTDGSIETRSYSIDNLTDRNGSADDYTAQTNVRLMAGGSFDLLDDVHARILLDNAGNPNRSGASSAFGNGKGNIQSVWNDFYFDNAYVKVDKVFGHVDLTMGTQFYNDPSDLAIYFGPQNDNVLSVTSLTAFRADADILGWAKFQGIAGKTSDNLVAGSNSDTDIYGGELNTDKLIPFGNLAAYYYNRQIKKAANAVDGNDTLGLYGARLKGDIKPVGGLGYHAEILQNAGRNNGIAGTPAYDGTAYFLGLDYGRDVNAMPVRANIEYGRGSHNFTSIAPGQRFGIIWGEFTAPGTGGPSTLGGVDSPNGAGLSNLKVLDGGVGINPIAKLGIDAKAYRFRYSDTAGGLTSAGTEYDLILSWKHSDNVMFEVTAADFQVGDALQNVGTPTSPITQLGADMKIKF